MRRVLLAPPNPPVLPCLDGESARAAPRRPCQDVPAIPRPPGLISSRSEKSASLVEHLPPSLDGRALPEARSPTANAHPLRSPHGPVGEQGRRSETPRNRLDGFRSFDSAVRPKN